MLKELSDYLRPLQATIDEEFLLNVGFRVIDTDTELQDSILGRVWVTVYEFKHPSIEGNVLAYVGRNCNKFSVNDCYIAADMWNVSKDRVILIMAGLFGIELKPVERTAVTESTYQFLLSTISEEGMKEEDFVHLAACIGVFEDTARAFYQEQAQHFQEDAFWFNSKEYKADRYFKFI